MSKIIKIVLISILFVISASANAVTFSSAKRALYQKVYGNQGFTIYTNCAWKRKKVDLQSCNLDHAFPRKQQKRAHRIEAEHLFPASWLFKMNGQWRNCVKQAKRLRKSARKYCRKHDSSYQRAHNDLINLRPSVGQINADRSNKPYSDQLSGEKKKTFRGRNKTMIITSRVAIPPASIRGDIARVGFYMMKHYRLRLNDRTVTMLKTWAENDPVSASEIRLNQRIKAVQGWGNEYVLDSAQASN